MPTSLGSSVRLCSCNAVVVVLLAAVLFSGPNAAKAQDANAQEKADREAVDRIRDAALEHSQIADMLGYFTDVIGPRLTGSPNLKRAQEYALGRLSEWGDSQMRISRLGASLDEAGR